MAIANCTMICVIRARPVARTVWRGKPKDRVLIHSDQGSQFTSMDWASFLKQHNMEHSMSRRGNCHDNAVADSFFNLLKRERVRRRTYRTRDEAMQDVFDYIEMSYNPQRKHARNGMLSPIDFEQQQKMKQHGVENKGLFNMQERLQSQPAPHKPQRADAI